MQIMRFSKRIKNGIRRRVKRLFYKKDERFNAIHCYLLKQVPAPVIFDVGAHRGESIQRFRGIFPQAFVHSFEPDQDNFQSLKSGLPNSNNLHINNFALGAKEEKRIFHRNAKSDTSSFNEVDMDSRWVDIRSKEYEVSKDAFTQKSYDVTIKTLDAYVEQNSIPRINLLKIDTQGFEDEVLKGARKALQKNLIDVIETELICAGLYKKSLTFYDIEQLLLPYGYRLYAVDKPGDLLTGGGVMVFNLIYVRPGLEQEAA